MAAPAAPAATLLEALRGRSEHTLDATVELFRSRGQVLAGVARSRTDVGDPRVPSVSRSAHHNDLRLSGAFREAVPDRGSPGARRTPPGTRRTPPAGSPLRGDTRSRIDTTSLYGVSAETCAGPELMPFQCVRIWGVHGLCPIAAYLGLAARTLREALRGITACFPRGSSPVSWRRHPGVHAICLCRRVLR